MRHYEPCPAYTSCVATATEPRGKALLARDERGLAALALGIKDDARQLGFTSVGIASIELPEDEAHFLDWLAEGLHGELTYMSRYGADRARAAAIVAGTVRVVSVRLDYWPARAAPAEAVLADPLRGYVARYATGRDYHKLMRVRLERLARRMAERIGPFGYRAFVDSGPVLEKALARNAGLGWIGKHTNLIDSRGGSWFFIGELFTDLPLPVDTPASAHCGTCSACMPACPTGAIVAPYKLDARRCISYLTIELKGSIPEPLRPLIGNRIYGCDDCQLVCPWNKFARTTTEPGFEPRQGLDGAALTALFAWTAVEFLERLSGSPIRRLGYERWLRNIAVALGNAPTTAEVIAALSARRDEPSELVREHVSWALARHGHPGSPPQAARYGLK
jgi:epoxyqueuosine reductase